jgi:hypothetical protein
MVGDSHEDVECGNAAGTATCLLAGGGNEVGACVSGCGQAASSPKHVARACLPTLTVCCLLCVAQAVPRRHRPAQCRPFLCAACRS